MRKKFLTKALSLALAAAMIFPSSIPATVNAAEPNGVSADNNIVTEVENEDTDNDISEDKQKPIDIWDIDVKTASYDDLLSSHNNATLEDRIAWVSTLSDEDINILKNTDNVYSHPYILNEDWCIEDGIVKGEYITLDFYQKCAKCKHAKAKYTQAQGSVTVNTPSGQTTISVTGITTGKSTSNVGLTGIKQTVTSGNGGISIVNSAATSCRGATYSSTSYNHLWACLDYAKPNGYYVQGASASGRNASGLSLANNKFTVVSEDTNCNVLFTGDAITTSNFSYVASNQMPAMSIRFYIYYSMQNIVNSTVDGSAVAATGQSFTINGGLAQYNVNYSDGSPTTTLSYLQNIKTGTTKTESFTQTFNANGGNNVSNVTTNRAFSGFTGGNGTSYNGSAVSTIVNNHGISAGGTITLAPTFGNAPATAPNTSKSITVTYDSKGGNSIASTSGTASVAYWASGNTQWYPGTSIALSGSYTWNAVYNNVSIKLADAPIKAGYTFDKWSIGKAGETVSIANNTTATANWIPNKYTVKFDVNGGEPLDVDTINAEYDQAFELPTPTRKSVTIGSNANGEDEVTTTYSFNGWSCSSGTYSGSANNLTTINGDTVTMTAQWVEAKTTKQYISEKNDPTPPSQDIIINTIDTQKLNDILSRLAELQKVSDLTTEDLKNIKNIVTSISGLDSGTVTKLVDLIHGSSALTDAQKIALLNHLANGYLTEDDRLLLRTIINSSSLSPAEKNALLTAINSFSYLSYAEQKKLLDALNAGSSATLKTGDGVEYIFTKGKDGMLTVAIKSLNGISDLVIPNSVTLAGTTFPVTKIAPNTFKGNTELKSVTIPGNISEIGASAFEGCTNLAKVTTTTGLQTIGDKAFKGCVSLTSFICPSTLKTIGNSAFEGCTKLETVTLNNGLITIGNKAFYGCSSLKKIVIPKTVLKIGSSAFEKCKKLKSVSFASYSSSQCQTIGDKAFKGCVTLTKIKLPKKINKIQKSTFSGCKKLKSVKGMSGVTDIGASAFANCKALKSITLQKKVQTIGSKAFYGCKNLKTVTIKSKAMTKVGSKAFKSTKKGIKFKVPNDKINAYTKLLKGKY